MRFLLIIIVAIFLSVTHYISYYIIKNKVVNERKWDLNICCGKTDGGEN